MAQAVKQVTRQIQSPLEQSRPETSGQEQTMAYIDDKDLDPDRLQEEFRASQRRRRVEAAVTKKAMDRPESERAGILAEQAERNDTRARDLSGPRGGTPYVDEKDHEKDEEDFRTRDRKKRSRLSFGRNEPYPDLVHDGRTQHTVEGFGVGGLYASNTKIGLEGTASRSRNILFGAFKKDETFLLNEYDPEKGYSYRRASKVERNPLQTRDVRYKADGKSHDRITYSYLGGFSERFDYDENGKESQTGSRTPLNSWYVDKEPGGLVTRTTRREVGGLHVSAHRAWNVVDEQGQIIARKSMLAHRGVGPYKMSWTQQTIRDRDNNESHQHLKTHEMGKGGWLFNRTTQYNPQTGQKTVNTRMLFGFISTKPRPVPMSAKEKAQITEREELRETVAKGSLRAKIEARDAGEARDARLRMVDAATIYRLPEPGTVRRLQDRNQAAQLDVKHTREHLSREQFRAVGAWVNSDGAMPYGAALAMEKARARGTRGSDHSSQSGLSEESGTSDRSAMEKTRRRSARNDHSATGTDTSSESGSSDSSRSGRSSGVGSQSSFGSEHRSGSMTVSSLSSASEFGRKAKQRPEKSDRDTDRSDISSEGSFDTSSSSSNGSRSSVGSDPFADKRRLRADSLQRVSRHDDYENSSDTSSQESFDSSSSSSSSSRSSVGSDPFADKHGVDSDGREQPSRHAERPRSRANVHSR